MNSPSPTSHRIPFYTSRPRILYAVVFFWLSWTGGRFLAPFLKNEIGLKDNQIGFVLGCQTGLGAFIGPFLGTIADRRQKVHKHGRIHVLCFGLSLGSIATLLHGIDYLLPSFTYSKAQSLYAKQMILMWHLSLRILFAVANGLSIPVLDGLTLAFLESEKNGDSADYGKERLHGAVWWAVANAILGPVLDIFGFKAIYFTSSLVLVFAYMSISMYTSSLDQKNGIDDNFSKKNHSSSPKSADHSTDQGSQTTFFHLKTICGSLFGASFVLCFFTLNSGTSVVENIIFLFFDELGGSNTFCGITVAVTVMFEIPIFHYASSILQIIGEAGIQQIACLAYVLRVIGYSLIPKNHMISILFLEPLHGVTYAFSQTSAVEFIDKFMPPGSEARGQGIMNIFRGAGAFVGLSLGGWAEQTFGPRIMYRGFAIAVFVALSQFSVAAKWENLKKSNSARYGTESETRGLISGVAKDEKRIPLDMP